MCGIYNFLRANCLFLILHLKIHTILPVLPQRLEIKEGGGLSKYPGIRSYGTRKSKHYYFLFFSIMGYDYCHFSLKAVSPSHHLRPSVLSNILVQSFKEPKKHLPVILVHLLCCCLLQIRNSGPANSTVQFIFYQPIIHRWRETDFFPCSATCGGGNGVHLAQELLASMREDLAIIRAVTAAQKKFSVVVDQILSSEWGQIPKPFCKADTSVQMLHKYILSIASHQRKWGLLRSLIPWKAKTGTIIGCKQRTQS